MTTKAKYGSEKVFNIVDIVLLAIFTVIIIFPIWNIVVSSFSSASALAKGSSLFWPSELSLENYKAVFRDSSILTAFFISVAKTVIGVVLHVFFCAMVAYALSKPDLVGRKLYTALGILTMFFSGGMIPTYLLIKQLGLLNSFWVYIIPALFSYYDAIILMNLFRQISPSLEEAATIDGCGTWRIFLSIIMPLSKPALATIALYHGVWQWNDFMTAKLYITKERLYPLQMKIYEIIVKQQISDMQNVSESITISATPKGIQLATIVITVLPIIMIYPLLQKYFIGGMMLGATKE